MGSALVLLWEQPHAAKPRSGEPDVKTVTITTSITIDVHVSMVIVAISFFNCDKNALPNFRDASYAIHVGEKRQSGNAYEHTRREAARQFMFRLGPAAVNQNNARFLFIFSNLRIASFGHRLQFIW